MLCNKLLVYNLESKKFYYYREKQTINIPKRAVFLSHFTTTTFIVVVNNLYFYGLLAY
jgi:hypothetical protein